MAREKRLPRTTSHMALNQAQLIIFWTTGRVNQLMSQGGCHFFFILNSQQHQEHLFTSLHFLVVKILYIFIKNKQAEYCFTPTPCQKIFNSAFLKSGTLWWQRSINIEHTQTNITNKHYIIQYFATRTWTILFCLKKSVTVFIHLLWCLRIKIYFIWFVSRLQVDMLETILKGNTW